MDTGYCSIYSSSSLFGQQGVYNGTTAAAHSRMYVGIIFLEIWHIHRKLTCRGPPLWFTHNTSVSMTLGYRLHQSRLVRTNSSFLAPFLVIFQRACVTDHMLLSRWIRVYYHYATAADVCMESCTAGQPKKIPFFRLLAVRYNQHIISMLQSLSTPCTLTERI